MSSRARLAPLAALALAGAAQAAAPTVEGSVRALGEARSANRHSALDAAGAVLGAGTDCGVVEARGKLRWRGGVLSGQALHSSCAPGGTDQEGRIDEAYWEQALGPLHATLGRKVVSWDVGYGFRPLDVVQRENRRAFIDQPLQGVPVLMVEHFGAALATSVVAANPGRSDTDTGRDEQALAARLYGQSGSADLHAVARWGAVERGSLGAAFSVVPDDALELHASARWGQRHATLAAAAPAPGPGARPWQPRIDGAFWQVLAGAQWTGRNRVSILAEAWYDGTAPSDGEWDDWAARNRGIVAAPVPTALAAAYLAGQAQALSRQNLRRANLLGRLAWTDDTWSPSIDLLVTPEDGGWVATAALAWQGNRWRLDGGLRVWGGPPDAVMRQLPDRGSLYLSATLPF